MEKFYVVIYETNVTKIQLETRANWIKKLYPKVNIIYAKNPPNQYGLDEKSARDLEIQEVQVDRKRKKYPISGTTLRNNITENENYIEKIVYKDMKEA